MAKIIVTEHGFVNIENVVSIYVGDYEMTYTAVYGHTAGGYPPTICKASKEHMQIIYTEIVEFLADNSRSLYNAKERVHELQMPH